MRIETIIALAGGAAFATACATTTTPASDAPLMIPDAQRGAVRSYMEDVLEIAAEDVWNVVAFNTSTDSEENFGPSDAESWAEAAALSRRLAAHGEELVALQFAYDEDDWPVYAQGVIDAAAASAAAAQARDLGGFFAAGDVIYDACKSCHDHYKALLPREE